MKRLLLFLLLTGSTAPLFAGQNWTPVSKEQKEYERISAECSRITEYYVGMGALRSSSYPNAIFQYLKNIGTPASLRVLKEYINRGLLPKSFLNCI